MPPAPPKQKRSRRREHLASSYQPDFIPSKRYTGTKPGYTFRHSYRGYGYYKDSASAPPRGPRPRPPPRRRPCATASRPSPPITVRGSSTPCSATGLTRRTRRATARYVGNGASDSALDELVTEARKDAILKIARVAAQRRDGDQHRRYCVEARLDGVGAQGLHGKQALQPVGRCVASKFYGAFVLNRRRRPPHRLISTQVGHPGLHALWRQGAEAARAADGDGAPGQGVAHEGPAGTHYPVDVLRSAAASATRARSGAGTARPSLQVFACDAAGAMRGPVVETTRARSSRVQRRARPSASARPKAAS